jgi:uncharacterized membrane protein
MTKPLLRHLRTKIFAGILVILPIGITFLVLRFVFNLLDSILGPLLPHIPVHLFYRIYNLPGLGVVAFFFLLYVVGVIATNVLGRRIVHWTDRLMVNIPVVKNIYRSSKQLSDAFSASRKGAFRQAVFVEFPQGGNFVLGFVTNELSDLEGQAKVTVFIPTTFVPPAGFLLFLPKEKALPSQMSIEEAIKSIMSVGIVTPPALPALLNNTHAGPTSEKEPVERLKAIPYPNSKAEGGS